MKLFNWLVFLLFLCFLITVSVPTSFAEISMLSANQNPIILAPLPDFDNNVNYLDWYRTQINTCNDPNAFTCAFTDSDLERDQALFLHTKASARLKNFIENPVLWNPDKNPDFIRYINSQKNNIQKYKKSLKQNYCLPVSSADEYISFKEFPYLYYSGLITKLLLIDSWKEPFESEVFVQNTCLVLSHANYIDEGLCFVEKTVANNIRHIAYRHLLTAIENNLLTDVDFEKLGVYLNSQDNKNLVHQIADSLRYEPAIWFEILQDVTQKRWWSKNFRLNKTALKKWEPAIGKTNADCIDFDPHKITNCYVAYFEACHKIFTSEFDPDFKKKLDSLQKTAAKQSTFFQIFPLTNFEAVYHKRFSLERMRCFIQAAILLKTGANKRENIIDPLTNQPFKTNEKDNTVYLNAEARADFKEITLKIKK
jgi:hypothetical protein